MQNRIIQWNCRGLKANYEKTLLLLKDYEPATLCLQETHLKDTDMFPSEITMISILFSVNNERAAGGVSISVNNNTPHSYIALHTNLQVVAVSSTLHWVVTLCSIYILPWPRLSPKDLGDSIPQLPSPFILLRDFNGHNILWDSKDINDKGRVFENLLITADLGEGWSTAN